MLKVLAEERGFGSLAVFGSVSRGEAGPNSDIDVLVQPPAGATITDMVELGGILERVLGRSVDVVSYGGLSRGIDDDILRDAVKL